VIANVPEVDRWWLLFFSDARLKPSLKKDFSARHDDLE
jgi:hypothetical protein